MNRQIHEIIKLLFNPMFEQLAASFILLSFFKATWSLRPRDSKAFRASLREGVELCELAVELKQTALLQHTIIFNKSCSLWLHIRAACCDKVF